MVSRSVPNFRTAVSCAASVERVEPGLRIVVVEDARASGAPLAVHADPDVGIRFEVAHVAGMSAELGDHPTDVALDVHADDGVTRLAGAPAGGLDDHEPRHQAAPHRGLRRWVHEMALDPLETPPLLRCRIVAHRWFLSSGWKRPVHRPDHGRVRRPPDVAVVERPRVRECAVAARTRASRARPSSHADHS